MKMKTLNYIFPQIDFSLIHDYIFVGTDYLRKLTKHRNLLEQFRQLYSFYVHGNIFDNYIFFPTEQLAIDFINHHLYWWTRKTKQIELFQAQTPFKLVFNENKHKLINVN